MVKIRSTIFLAYFAYALLQIMSYAPRFCQMKDLVKIYICGKFYQYSICGCDVKNFHKVFCIDSASMKWPLFEFFGHFFPQILFNLAEILTRGSLQ